MCLYSFFFVLLLLIVYMMSVWACVMVEHYILVDLICG